MSAFDRRLAAVLSEHRASTRTFGDWLASFSRDQTARGDLARDAAADVDFPDDPSDLGELLDYLESCGACDGALAALRSAWAARSAAP